MLLQAFDCHVSDEVELRIYKDPETSDLLSEPTATQTSRSLSLLIYSECHQNVDTQGHDAEKSIDLSIASVPRDIDSVPGLLG